MFHTAYILGLSALLLTACSSSPLPTSASAALANQPGSGFEEISVQAIGLIGTPYRTGGNTPDGGFDCSGLARYVVLSAMGLRLPRTTTEMSQVGVPLQRTEIAAGDLVFFNTQGSPYSHVGIYVGQNRFVHAPSNGGTVRLEDMNKTYWVSRYTGARRVAFSPAALAQKRP